MLLLAIQHLFCHAVSDIAQRPEVSTISVSSRPRFVPLIGQLSNRQFGGKLDDLLARIGPARDEDRSSGAKGKPRLCCCACGQTVTGPVRLDRGTPPCPNDLRAARRYGLSDDESGRANRDAHRDAAGEGTAIGTGFGNRSGTGLGPQRAAVSPDQIGGDRAEVGVYPRMRTGHAGDLFLQEFAARFAVSERVEKRTEGHSPDIT